MHHLLMPLTARVHVVAAALSIFVTCAAFGNNSCESYLTPQPADKILQEGKQRIGGTIRHSREGKGFRLSYTDPQGTFLGYLYYEISSDGRTIVDTHARSAIKLIGISKLLRAAMIKLNPKAELIDSVFIDTNADVFSKALADGLPEEQALKQTPFYRSLAPLGFTNILTLNVTYGISGFPNGAHVILAHEDALVF